MSENIKNPETQYWAQELVNAEREIRAMKEIADMLRQQLLADVKGGAKLPSIDGAVIEVRKAHTRSSIDSKAVKARYDALGESVPHKTAKVPETIIVRLQGE